MVILLTLKKFEVEEMYVFAGLVFRNLNWGNLLIDPTSCEPYLIIYRNG